MEQEIISLFENNKDRFYSCDEIIKALKLRDDNGKEFGEIMSKLINDNNRYLNYALYYKCPKCKFEKTYKSSWDISKNNIQCDECQNIIMQEQINIKFKYNNTNNK